MIILGINAFHPDSSACIYVNGQIIAAVEEERFVRVKHFSGIPFESIKFCLKHANVTFENIDFISVNYNHFYNFKQKTQYLLYNKIWKKIKIFKNKLNLKKILIKKFKIKKKVKFYFVPHHLSHIASAYFTSGFKSAVGLTVDGSGDFSTLETFRCNLLKIEILTKNYFPNSLGFLYTGITQLLGFKKFGDEYKVMALAAFGKPKKINEIGKILSFIPPYKIKINKKFFNFNQETLLETKFDLIKKSLKKFLSINNDNKNIISKKKLNIASSLQTYFQSVILKISRNLYLENYSNNLCLAGGCFYNSVLNGYLKKNLKFKKISIYPNAGDAGGSVGAALYVASNFDKNFKIKKRHNLFLGPKYSSRNISEALNKFKKINNQFNIYFIPNYNQIYKIVSDLMIKNKIVCWFQGRAEFGPRALGNRSILTSARAKNIREILNKKIKLREKFRPFAASIILEEANKYFEIDSDNYQFMNFVFKSRPITKKKYPAIVHFDGTTRIHTVNKKDNKIFYNLLKFHYKRFRDPLVLNTSLNIDEPMCLTPEDVLKSFANSKSKIDCIVLNQYLLINKHSG